MIPHKHCDLIKLWAAGHKIQCLAPIVDVGDNIWVDIKNPDWDESSVYRLKPEVAKDKVYLHYDVRFGRPYMFTSKDEKPNFSVEYDLNTGKIISIKPIDDKK